MLDECRMLFSINNPLSGSRVRQILLYVMFSIIPVLCSGNSTGEVWMDISNRTPSFKYFFLNCSVWRPFKELQLARHKDLLDQDLIVETGFRIVNTNYSGL